MAPDEFEREIDKYHLVSYTDQEEQANRLTGVLGMLLSLIGLFILVYRSTAQGDPWLIFSCTLYGVTLVVFYSVSTIYHSVRRPRLKYLFRLLDHASIFLAIAGTYTPFSLVSLRSASGEKFFAAVWGLAIAGTILKLAMTPRMRILGPILYLLLGWLVVFVYEPLLAAISGAGIGWLLAGGLFYSFGLIFFAWTRLSFNHAVWHLFVLAGSACHYFAVLWYVVG